MLHSTFMTLRRKMSFQILAMILGLLVISMAAVRGLRGLKQDYGVALRGYQQLRLVFDTGAQLSNARLLLEAGSDSADATAKLAAASAAVDQLGEASPARLDATRADEIVHLRENLRQAADALAGRAVPADGDIAVPATIARSRAVDAITAAIGRLPALTANIRHDIEANQQATESRLKLTTWSLLAVCGVVIVGALLLGAWQYRGVVKPLNRLTAGVRRIAAGRFEQRVAVAGNDEFARLADDFNKMAAELDGFYRQLEAKVAQKSKELIQSERLASVGYLAAGVAHEINNPLGIITGYAELLLQRLPDAGRANGAASTSADVQRTLRIICDEAYRCKRITEKLLSLARQADDEARRPVDLSAIASSVASLMGGLRQFADRELKVRADAGADLTVNAVEAQMNQVVTNLVLNALEATARADGAVLIDVARKGNQVELMVTDNGRGMTADTIERVFEPFFTQKHDVPDSTASDGDRKIGTGLGLSITHAIVEGHGGRIRAASDGLGKGSRFVVELPPARSDDSELPGVGAKAVAGELR